MAKPLVSLVIGTPGLFGLNTQDAGSVLPPGWATQATNCAYDDLGRLASRRGHKQRNGTVVTNTPTISACHNYVDASGNRLIVFAADNKLWKDVNGTMTDITGTATTPTGDNWQFANFNGTCVGYQSGHAPVVLATTGGSFADATGTQKNGSMVLSAYGRLWTVESNTLWYSDLLINNYTGGSSGSFDLAQYWPNGMDEAVALAEFNGFLIVFGKESMILYQNADDVTNMAIADTVAGIGCPYRDSIQRIADDLIFMSNSGLRSLKATLARQGDERLTDISRHVRDDIVLDVTGETAVEVKSVYQERLGFYLLSLPTDGSSYYFDTRTPNPDGSWKVTKWDIAPTALAYDLSNTTLYMAVEAGYLSDYTGFKDGVASDGTGGSSYIMDFRGVWNDFDEDKQGIGELIKIPKRVSVLAAGISGGNVEFTWSMDYSDTVNNRTLSFTTNAPAQYGVAQYAVDSYAGTADFERVRAALARSGQVIKPGVRATINGFEFSLQRIDILAKVGKLGL